jgi:hypothetical protein
LFGAAYKMSFSTNFVFLHLAALTLLFDVAIDWQLAWLLWHPAWCCCFVCSSAFCLMAFLDCGSAK